MKWILFLVFVGAFFLIVVGTLVALFFGVGSLQPGERDLLFKAFILEIGAAVFALFYSVFGLKRKDGTDRDRVRLTLGENTDVRGLIGTKATLSASRANGASIKDTESQIFDDNGPYIPLDLPETTHAVFLTVKVGDRTYSGSFVLGTHLVNLIESGA